MKINTEIGCSMPTIFIVFLVLKLTNVINWSWWWVTSPLWLPLVCALGIVLVIALIIGLCGMCGALILKNED